MITISLCMIVKNEEDVLARCLDTVKDIADEIILVDTGSTDRTKEIAQSYTSHVFDYAWSDDFAAARNFSFAKATMQYRMWLDADDVILPDDQKKLLRLKETLPPETDVVMMKYHTAFDAQGKPTFSYYRERLLRNTPAFLWQGAVHEAITPSGIIRYEEIAVSHQKTHPSDPDRNLRIFEKLLANGETLAPREQFYYARELYYHGRDEQACGVLKAFLDSGMGWIENEIEACRLLSWCLYRMKDDAGALRALLRSMEFDTPRAEICCDIGKHFLDRALYQRAIFWYVLALTRPRDDESGGFVSPDCYGFLPCIQLCVCYDRLGAHQMAADYNERAGRYRPDTEPYLSNKKYFEALLAK